jgi:hypothetical protein
MVINQKGNWCKFNVDKRQELNSIKYTITFRYDKYAFREYTDRIPQYLNKIICTLTLK